MSKILLWEEWTQFFYEDSEKLRTTHQNFLTERGGSCVVFALYFPSWLTGHPAFPAYPRHALSMLLRLANTTEWRERCRRPLQVRKLSEGPFG
jgi:hypothetical protein